MKLKYLLFFLFVAFFSLIPIKAATPNVEYIDGVYSNRVKNGRIYFGQFGFVTIDGKVVYCMDPYNLIGDNYTVSNNNFNSMSNDTLRYIKLVANYVEEKVQNRNVEYYMAAQELIWRKISGADVYWTTENDGAGSKIGVYNQKQEIERYIESFNKKPSFSGYEVKDKFFTMTELEDTNNVLNQYRVVNNSRNSIVKNGNKLSVNILDSRLSTINLIKERGTGNPIYYESSNGQDLAFLSSYVESNTSITVKATDAYHETVTLQFLDIDDKSLVKDEVKVRLTNVDTKEQQILTVNNGTYVTDLKEGKYVVDVINVPYGYLLTDSQLIEVSEYNILREQIFTFLLPKPIGEIDIAMEIEGVAQIYRAENNELLATFDSPNNLRVELGQYYVIDLVNNKKYDLDIHYINQYVHTIRCLIIITASNDKTDEIKDNDSNNEETKKEDLNEEEDKKDFKIVPINDENKELENIEPKHIIKNENINKKQANYLKQEAISENKSQLPNTINYVLIGKIIILSILLFVLYKDVKSNKT